MLWHVLRFDLSHLDDERRLGLEKALETLKSIPQVRWFLLGRDVEEPNVTGVIMLMENTADLAIYRVHPTHVGVVAELREAQARSVRLNLPSDSLPE